MDRYLAPDPAGHTAFCATFVWRWRFEQPGGEASDVTRWPCRCPGGPHPWTLVERAHPRWCKVPGKHAWHDCTVSRQKE